MVYDLIEDWQQITSLIIVAVTAFLLVRYEVKKRQQAKLRACGHDCGCSSDVLEKIKAETQPKFYESKSAVK